MNKGILLLGGGGHCASVLDSLLTNSEYDRIGIIDNSATETPIPDKIHIIGCDDDLFKLFSEGYIYAFVTIGSIGNISIREKLYKKIKDIGFTIPNITDKTAAISEHVKLGEGIFIGKNCVVNARTEIYNCAIINSASVIEHDCVIGEFAHISPGAVLCGGVKIGYGTHVGAGVTIKQYLSIGEYSIIGMGSVVLNNIGNHILSYGNPCKEVKKL